ncbi:MAG: glycosyltransferase, partial [Candidatus Obscuribacterales bacterium]|nr:glycosyltransferase [Candidatus Obscuribacterales bacterium]
VVPSRWYENTPLVIQSALASKTPLIVTNLGGMAELVRHGFNGLLFELNNVKSLTEQLTRLLDEPELLAQMRENIPPERSIPQMVDDIESVYLEALSEAKHKHDRIAD